MTFKTFALVAVMAGAAFGQQFSTPVRDVDSAVRNAVAFKYTCLQSAPNNSNALCSTGYQVPTGFRLVVTQVNINANTAQKDSNVSYTYFEMRVSLATVQMAPIFKGESADQFTQRGTTQCFFVVDSLDSSSVMRGILDNSTITVSGYLIRL